MCLDTLSKFSCTPFHDSHNTNPIHGYTISSTTECALVLKISNARSERARYPCPKGPHQSSIDTRTDNRRNLCPVCTEHSGNGIAEKEFEIRRKIALKGKQDIEPKLEKRRQKALEWKKRVGEQKKTARPAEIAKQADLEKQPKLSRHPARARHEEPRKLNAPTRRPQARVAKESPGETVARRYANRQLDKERECREDENDRIQRQLEREFSTEKTQRGR
ncbi:hypothetical protein ACHAO1_010433 [Botrytis cinerea]